MLTKSQEIYLQINSEQHIVSGEAALQMNGLIYGNGVLCVNTPHEFLDGLTRGDVVTEYYHFNDNNYCRPESSVPNLQIPSKERAIIDTINFIDKNFIEGLLIEALQEYISRYNDLSKLYEVADHYKVPRDKVDYWIKEAQEESDMSMG